MSDYIDSKIKNNITKLIQEIGDISYEAFIEQIEKICKRVLICDYRLLILWKEKKAHKNDSDLEKLNELLRNKHSIEIVNPALHNLLIDRISFIFANQGKSSKLSCDMIIDLLNKNHPELNNQINDGIKLLKIADCFKATKATILEPNKIGLSFEEYKKWLREKRDKFLIGIALDIIYEPKAWSLMLYNSDEMMSKMQSLIAIIRNDKETLTDSIVKFYSEVRNVIEENTVLSYELFWMVVVKCVFEQIDYLCKDRMTRYHTNDLLGLLVMIVIAHAGFSSMIHKFIKETAKPKAQQKQHNPMLATNSNQNGSQSSYKPSSNASGSRHPNQPIKARSTISYPRPDDKMRMPQTSSYFDNNQDRQMGTNDKVFGQQEFRNISNNTGVSIGSRGRNTSDFATRSYTGYQTRGRITNGSGYNTWQRKNDSETQRNHSYN